MNMDFLKLLPSQVRHLCAFGWVQVTKPLVGDYSEDVKSKDAWLTLLFVSGADRVWVQEDYELNGKSFPAYVMPERLSRFVLQRERSRFHFARGQWMVISKLTIARDVLREAA